MGVLSQASQRRQQQQQQPRGRRWGAAAWDRLLREGLRKARSKWDSHDGDRQFWLTSCRDTDSLHELASLLQTLEEAVKKMQTGLDVAERPPWRTEASAHEYIGVYARRFFEGFGGRRRLGDRRRRCVRGLGVQVHCGRRRSG